MLSNKVAFDSALKKLEREHQEKIEALYTVYPEFRNGHGSSSVLEQLNKSYAAMSGKHKQKLGVPYGYLSSLIRETLKNVKLNEIVDKSELTQKIQKQVGSKFDDFTIKNVMGSFLFRYFKSLGNQKYKMIKLPSPRPVSAHDKD